MHRLREADVATLRGAEQPVGREHIRDWSPQQTDRDWMWMWRAPVAVAAQPAG